MIINFEWSVVSILGKLYVVCDENEYENFWNI